MGKADDLFDAQLRMARCEGMVHDLIEIVLGDAWADITYDYYDASMEIYGVPAGRVLSETEQALFWAEGFQKIWTHEHEKEARRPGERFYAAVVGKDSIV